MKKINMNSVELKICEYQFWMAKWDKKNCNKNNDGLGWSLFLSKQLLEWKMAFLLPYAPCVFFFLVQTWQCFHKKCLLYPWKKWYFVAKIVLTYFEKKMFYRLTKTLDVRRWKPRIFGNRRPFLTCSEVSHTS